MPNDFTPRAPRSGWSPLLFSHQSTVFKTLHIERGFVQTMKKMMNWFKKTAPFTIPAIIFIVILGWSNGEPPKRATYTTFMEQVEDKKVSEAYLDRPNGLVIYELENGKRYSTTHPEYDDFKKELLEKDVKVSVASSTSFLSGILPILQLVFFAVLIYFIWNQMKAMRPQIGGQKAGEVIKKPKVKFSDVAGYAEVKEDVQNAVSFLKEPKRYLERGARMPKGMILYGDPGTGKTLIAKAIAGEAGVPFYSASGSDFIEKYVGVGAQRIRHLFDEAKKNAPCIVFIDEIDAIGGQRGSESNSESTQTINALLTQMDGFAEDSGVLVIATTNRLETLDKALIRPGRFDMQVKVPIPYTSEERLEIIQVHTKNKTFADDVDFMVLAKQWIGFSGADIESIINSAAIISVDSGKENIDMECFTEAFDRKILKGHFKKDSQKDREEDVLKLVAYHEAGHAVVGKLLETGMNVSRVTILASTTGAGGITLFSPNKMGLHTIEEMENDVKVSYAGRIAELLLFGDEKLVTTGASGDIEQATQTIRHMISTYGMTKEMGMLNLEILGVDKSVMVKQATELSARLYNETETLMKENWDKVVRVAEALLEKETIMEAELDELLKDPEDVTVETESKEPEVLSEPFGELVDVETEENEKKAPMKKPVTPEDTEETF